MNVYMYHLDIGRVYVHPNVVTKEEALQLKLPSENYDSIQVTIQQNEEDKKLDNSLSRIGSTDDGLSVPPANYSQYYLVFDKERISPAYKLSFRLNNETEDFQKQLQETGKDPAMTSKELTKIRQDTSHIGKTLAIMDLCKKEGH